MKKEQKQKIEKLNGFFRVRWTVKQNDEYINELKQKLITQITNIIDWHERHKKCYFWQSFGNAASRRRQEEEGNFETFIEFDDDNYYYKSWKQVSCKNVYQRSIFKKNDEKKDVRAFKKLLTRVKEV